MYTSVSIQTDEKSCQVNFLIDNSILDNTFICNRLESNTKCYAETQTDLCVVKPRLCFSDLKKCNSATNTPVKVYVDNSVQCDTSDLIKTGFLGAKSITSNQEMLELAGVSMNTFNLFMEKVCPQIENCKVSKENRMLIFFIKLKTGLDYSAIGVIFQVHRTTVSRIFINTLLHVSSALRNAIQWLDKDTVLSTTPDCFKPKYENVRIIIDCTEFPIEIPSRIDQRVLTYSHYKKGFTTKALIGCSPSGLITFVSPCAGGRKSDCQITVESGLLNLLEDGDEVLADKGFPDIRSKIDEMGKKILLVMPPFLHNNEFSL